MRMLACPATVRPEHEVAGSEGAFPASDLAKRSWHNNQDIAN